MKKLCLVLAIIIALWVAIGAVDYIRVSHFERPIFCVLNSETSASDGGSGVYNGLGYSFDIKGNFMPLDEYPGVTEYTCYIFGNEIANGLRD